MGRMYTPPEDPQELLGANQPGQCLINGRTAPQVQQDTGANRHRLRQS